MPPPVFEFTRAYGPHWVLTHGERRVAVFVLERLQRLRARVLLVLLRAAWRRGLLTWVVAITMRSDRLTFITYSDPGEAARLRADLQRLVGWLRVGVAFDVALADPEQLASLGRFWGCGPAA
jgi:hypothetical protein